MNTSSLRRVMVTAGVVVVLGLAVWAPQAYGSVCIPTCATDDGKFLALAGPGLNSLAGGNLEFQFAAPPSASVLKIEIFDGDGGGMWDYGTAEIQYTLYEDPAADGSSMTVVDSWVGDAAGVNMPDNEWYTKNVPLTPGVSQAPSGNYFYRLVVEMPGPSFQVVTGLKVRTDYTVRTYPGGIICYIGMISDLNDLGVVYPNWPLLDVTTYDGTFDFAFEIFSSLPRLTIYDGDFDFGAWDTTTEPTVDTDDEDTPPTPPDFAFDALPEGAKGMGTPPDDFNRDDAGAVLRSPSITYRLLPNGEDEGFNNLNPSGTGEWEQFTITSDPNEIVGDVTGATADYFYAEGPLPAGTYMLEQSGVDMFNMNALRIPSYVLCEGERTDPNEPPPICNPLRPYIVGDTVFNDMDGDGVQDGGEPGIPGVVVNLLDSSGEQILTTTTGSGGTYTFEVEGQVIDDETGATINDGGYTIEIAAENFDSGSALESYFSTTEGEIQTNTVIDANVLDYDFGYQTAQGQEVNVVGDTIFNDFNGDGIQQAGEPGIEGVMVSLLDSGGVPIDFAVSGIDGFYSFEVSPGTYTVEVTTGNFAPGGVLEGYVSTTGGESQTNTVAGGDVLNFDFGYLVEYCGVCEGKATVLTFKYLGSVVDAEIKVFQKKGRDVIFLETVQPSETFTVVGTWKRGALGTELLLYVNTDFNVQIHTSCSQPLFPGMIFGDFLLVAGESKTGGLICPGELDTGY